MRVCRQEKLIIIIIISIASHRLGIIRNDGHQPSVQNLMFLAYTVGTNWNQNEAILHILTYIDSNTRTKAACDVHGTVYGEITIKTETLSLWFRLKHAQSELKKKQSELKNTEKSYKKDKDVHDAIEKSKAKLEVRIGPFFCPRHSVCRKKTYKIILFLCFFVFLSMLVLFITIIITI